MPFGIARLNKSVKPAQVLVEYRNTPTRVIGEEFYIYTPHALGQGQHSRYGRIMWWQADLPTGVLVGTAKISECVRPLPGTKTPVLHEWHLKQVKRLREPIKPKRRPRPVWFNPF
jgi:hypothetical protein